MTSLSQLNCRRRETDRQCGCPYTYNTCYGKVSIGSSKDNPSIKHFVNNNAIANTVVVKWKYYVCLTELRGRLQMRCSI